MRDNTTAKVILDDTWLHRYKPMYKAMDTLEVGEFLLVGGAYPSRIRERALAHKWLTKGKRFSTHWRPGDEFVVVERIE